MNPITDTNAAKINIDQAKGKAFHKSNILHNNLQELSYQTYKKIKSRKKAHYVLDRASKRLCASGVTPTPILSASASACLQITTHQKIKNKIPQNVESHIQKP